MASFQRKVSKSRNIFADKAKKGKTFDMKISAQTHDSNMSAVNGKFLAVNVETPGGGAFVVIPIDKTGRCENSHRAAAHKKPILDIAWNPFNDHQIASASDDCTVKIWNIPEGGLNTDMHESAATLSEHSRKVGVIAWHPTAENILACSCCVKITIWDVTKPDNPAQVIDVASVADGHTDAVCSLNWNQDGSLLVASVKRTSKCGANVYIIDPRLGTTVTKGLAHTESRPVKAEFCGKYLVTSGFSSGERQIGIWNPNDLSSAVTCIGMDRASGILFFFYEEATKALFIFGKGSTQIWVYELLDEKPYLSERYSEQKLIATHSTACSMPKRHLNFMDCEVYRFYRLCTGSNSMVEPVAMIVPRKSETFQDDLFPPCYAGVSALTADEWISGTNKQPIMQVITKDGLGSVCNATPLSTTFSQSLSKQSSVSSNSSDSRRIEQDIPNNTATLTSSGEFDDSQYKKQIQVLTSTVNSLRSENERLKSDLQKKEAIIDGVKKLVK